MKDATCKTSMVGVKFGFGYTWGVDRFYYTGWLSSPGCTILACVGWRLCY